MGNPPSKPSPNPLRTPLLDNISGGDVALQRKHVASIFQPADATDHTTNFNLTTTAAWFDPGQKYVPKWKHDDDNGETICTHFKGDYNPDYSTPYWIEDDHKSDDGSKTLVIVVPFFNEESQELEDTLESIYAQIPQLALLKLRVHVLLVLDGWWKASSSMKDYVLKMFPEKKNQEWGLLIEPLPDKYDWSHVDTYIVQYRTRKTHEIRPVRINFVAGQRARRMRISMVVKRENRRKHNAHVWFLASFAPFYDAEFAFLTDCGTKFGDWCLTHLAQYLIDNEKCSAVTGRQRVMTARMQRSVESWLSYEFLYRWAQCYDYEASTACFNGAFSAAGMLPVVPGPCGMFRFRDIYNDELRLKRYREEIDKEMKSLATNKYRYKARLESCEHDIKRSGDLFPNPTNIHLDLKDKQKLLEEKCDDAALLAERFAAVKAAEKEKALLQERQNLVYGYRQIITDRRNTLTTLLETMKQSADYLERLHAQTTECRNRRTLFEVIKRIEKGGVQQRRRLDIKALESKERELTAKADQFLFDCFQQKQREKRAQDKKLIPQLDMNTEEDRLQLQSNKGKQSMQRFRRQDEERIRQAETRRRKEEGENLVDVIDHYLHIVHQDPDETGLVVATLLLAEDRILSYGAVLKTTVARFTAYDPRAIFYFQAETNEDMLLPQRRRWINGTVAGYVWLLQSGWIWESQLGFPRKLAILALVMFQLTMYAVTTLAPALFIVGLGFAINSCFPNPVYNTVASFLYAGLYLTFVYAHTRDDSVKLVKWMFRIVVGVNCFVTPWLIAMVIIQVMQGNWSDFLTSDPSKQTIMLWFVLVNVSLPWILTFLHGPEQLLHMVRSFVQFYLFLPTMVAYFGAYSSSRIWDLTWGNRPSDSLSSITHTQSAKEQEDNKARIKTTARTVCWAIAVANLFLVILLSELQQVQIVLLVVTCAVFGAAFTQMFISFLFLLSRALLVRLPTYIRQFFCWEATADYLLARFKSSAWVSDYGNIEFPEALHMVLSGANNAAFEDRLHFYDWRLYRSVLERDKDQDPERTEEDLLDPVEDEHPAEHAHEAAVEDRMESRAEPVDVRIDSVDEKSGHVAKRNDTKPDRTVSFSLSTNSTWHPM